MKHALKEVHKLEELDEKRKVVGSVRNKMYNFILYFFYRNFSANKKHA